MTRMNLSYSGGLCHVTTQKRWTLAVLNTKVQNIYPGVRSTAIDVKLIFFSRIVAMDVEIVTDNP